MSTNKADHLRFILAIFILLIPSIPALSASTAPGPSLLPASVSLHVGQSYQLALQLNGSLPASTTGVQWSVWPQVGSISSSGLYYAPPSIASSQTIWGVALILPASTSVTPIILYSSITILPPIAVAISPGSVSRQPSTTQQFTATVSNTPNTAVIWSLSSPEGSISSSGLYTAPAIINSETSVAVTATSVADPTKHSTVAVTLLPPPPVPAVTLPVEVMGADGTSKSIQFAVAKGSVINGTMNLTLQIHGLEYESQASIQVNKSPRIPLTSAYIIGLGANYGGIGGGFSTLSLKVPLLPGVLQVGANAINFVFNATDGNSDGYRVLAFNFSTPGGPQLLPASSFTQSDPAKWVSPLPDSVSIAAGKNLWQSATISQPVPGGPATTLRAHCGDCHATDGRDLKYFNYSNASIYARSIFHGLNATQANQLVSYIRSLTTPAPPSARPWNPPYQPGPGLDSQPVTNWAAGAGLNAVLSSDQGMRPYVAPALTTADFNPQNYLNIRQTPIALQLLDWNHWLPRVHPVDVWGSDFINNGAYADYQSLRSNLVVGDPNTYVNQSQYIVQWDVDCINFRNSEMAGFIYTNPWTRAQANSIYSFAKWQMTKRWELLQQFGLEGFGQQYFGTSKADTRAWPNNVAFMASPNMLHIPEGSPGIGNGLVVTSVYDSMAWYYLQLIQNSGNGTQDGPSPIDWAYVYGFIKDLDHASQVPEGMMLMTWLQKSLQIATQLQPDITQGQAGWFGPDPDISRLTHYDFVGGWQNTSQSTEAEIMQAYVDNWLSSISSYSLSQLYASGYISSTDAATSNPDGNKASGIYYSIPRLKYYGVSQTTVNNLANWAATVWPGTNWSVLTTQTCVPAGNPGNLSCQ